MSLHSSVYSYTCLPFFLTFIFLPFYTHLPPSHISFHPVFPLTSCHSWFSLSLSNQLLSPCYTCRCISLSSLPLPSYFSIYSFSLSLFKLPIPLLYSPFFLSLLPLAFIFSLPLSLRPSNPFPPYSFSLLSLPVLSFHLHPLSPLVVLSPFSFCSSVPPAPSSPPPAILRLALRPLPSPRIGPNMRQPLHRGGVRSYNAHES